MPNRSRNLRALVAILAWSALAVGCASQEKPSPIPEVKQHLEQGQQYYNSYQYREAFEEFAKGLANAEAEDNLYGQAVSYLSLALCYQRLGQPREAVRMYAEAERVIRLMETEQPNVDEIDKNILYGRYHETQAEIYKSRREWDKAASALDLAEKYYAAAAN